MLLHVCHECKLLFNTTRVLGLKGFIDGFEAADCLYISINWDFRIENVMLKLLCSQYYWADFSHSSTLNSWLLNSCCLHMAQILAGGQSIRIVHLNEYKPCC